MSRNVREMSGKNKVDFRSEPCSRVTVFHSKVIKNASVIECTALPPTSSAAAQHSYRVYHTIQTWLENPLQPTEWGWTIVNDHYVPVTTNLKAAPDELMSIIYCNCKTGCKNNQCSCRKNGLNYGPGCAKCMDNCTRECNRECNDEEYRVVEAIFSKQSMCQLCVFIFKRKYLYNTSNYNNVSLMSFKCILSH